MKSKICKSCKQDLPVSAFRKIKYFSASGKLKYCYTGFCRKCRYKQARSNAEKVRKYDAEWKRKWRANNKDKVHSANQKVYYKNREKYLAQKHEYYLKNRDKILAYNRAYLQTPTGKNKNRNGGMKYEANKYNAKVEEVDREIVYERDGGICYLCGKLVDRDSWQLEHIIPLSRGGEHSYSNVAVSHARCNISKKNKTPDEYFRWLENIKE